MKAKSARLFGIFFILSFVSYALGLSLIEKLQHSQIQAHEILEHKYTIVLGALLISIFHTIFNLGLLLLMFQVLKTVSKGLAMVYLAVGSFSTLMLALGGVFLLLPLRISETLGDFSLALHLASGVNFYAYQLGMILWGGGGLIFCYLLYKSRLVPAVFPMLGGLGYVVFIVGCVLELLGEPYGVILSMPGGLFEVALSIWLMVKGFDKAGLESQLSQSLSDPA